LPLRDKVVAELRRRIIECEYPPGHRLTEDRLALDFGVSRNPVREAIRVLEREGFLIAQARRGAVVASLSTQDVENLFEVRLALEVLSAQLAAQRIDAAGAARLQSIVAETAATETGSLAALEHGLSDASAPTASRRAHSADAVTASHHAESSGLALSGLTASVTELARLNTAFHAEVCRMSGNALLVSMMDSLHDRLEWVYRQTALRRAPHSWREHEALAIAISAGDAEAAGHAAHTHVWAARQIALSYAADHPNAAADGRSFDRSAADRDAVDPDVGDDHRLRSSVSSGARSNGARHLVTRKV